MYETHFGLKDKPFTLLPVADSLYLSPRHRVAVNFLQYGLASQATIAVLSGEVGTGKTSVIRHFMRTAGDRVALGVITNSSKNLGTLMQWVAMALDIRHEGASQAEIYEALVQFLLARYAEGKRTVLVIDEAQNLAPDVLEDLRMLSNVNNERDVLLQLILVGQPELLETLKRPELRQFVQRVAGHCKLEPLSAAETAKYIRYRLMEAGGTGHEFDDPACAAVHYFSGGIPRLINLVCDMSMVYAYAEDRTQVGLGLVIEAAEARNRSELSPLQDIPPEAGTEAFEQRMKQTLAGVDTWPVPQAVPSHAEGEQSSPSGSGASPQFRSESTELHSLPGEWRIQIPGVVQVSAQPRQSQIINRLYVLIILVVVLAGALGFIAIRGVDLLS